MGKPKKKNSESPRWLNATTITAIATLVTAIGGLIAVFLSPQMVSIFFPTPTSALSIIKTATPEPTSTATNAPTKEPSPTPTEVVPKMYGFQACPAQCNGQNQSNNFVEGTTRIYIQFNYENIPPKADYTRIWTMDGKEWIRYVCAWDGPVSGTESIRLSEPEKLHSGVWEMTVIVNDEILLKEQLVVVGNITLWTPVGTVNGRCRQN